MKKNLLILLCCVLWGGVNAQYYDTGADPASTDWWQIKTENYQIIFPREYESQAQIFAAKMDYAYDFVVESMSGKPRKLSVIIHTQSAISNGMVAWAPRRMELWTVPSQDAFNYSQEWMEQLIVHETRHFVQENKMNQGFTKVLKVLMGEQAEMIPLGMMTRQWFMEGDAVATETALSKSGRGRMPTFEQGLRALTLERGAQSYDVAHLGTYNHYMPNHYEVGYHTVAINRLYRDKDIFNDKMDRIGKFKTLRGLRDSRRTQYYGFAIDELAAQWQAQDDEIEKTPYELVVARERDYNSYAFLQEDGGKLYAVRNSLSKIPEIVEIDSSGVTRVVASVGWMSEPDFSVRNGQLVYADIIGDARWEQRSYADLFVVDLASGESRRITRGRVLQAPSFNADASQIVAQSVDGNGAFVLQIIETESGRVVRQLPNPENQFYFSPKWSDDGTKIVYVSQEKDAKSLKYFDLASDEEVLLVEGTYGEMAHPVLEGDKVYFSASYSGINNVYSCDIASKEVVRESSARFGADYPAVLGGEMYYCSYTSSGYLPVKHLPSAVAGESLAEVEDMSLGFADRLTEQEGEVIDFSNAPMKKYEVKNYSRVGHLLNIHSWFPALTSGELGTETEDDMYAGLTLLSQNKLSTSFLTASYDANPANSDERFSLNYTYNGFYPKLGLDVSWGDFVSSSTDPRMNEFSYLVNDMIVRPSVTLPLSLKKGVYSLYFSNMLFGEYVRVNIPEYDYKESYFSRGFSTFFSRAKQSASRDLYSPFLQQVYFMMSYDDSDYYDEAYKLASYARVNFPGVGAHHVLKLGLNWQKKDYYTSNALQSLPRGYVSSANTGMMYASADYFLPLTYPDANLGGVFNIKRMSMSLYGDIAQVSELDVYGDVVGQSLLGGGGSLFFDTNILRYEVDVRMGVQAGVASYSGSDELSYPVNFIFEMSVF